MKQITELIRYEDADIIVCEKPAGLAVQTRSMREIDLESMLRNYLAAKGEKPYIGIVHRLDQPVEGIMVFAKNPMAAAELNRQMQQNKFEKYYLAVIRGKLPDASGTLVDYLTKDAKSNTSSVVTKETAGAKRAELQYETLSCKDNQSLVKIKLKTGRHHQIRVQMAQQGCPLLGDRKYGILDERKNSSDNVALCSYHIGFQHPGNKKKLIFEVIPGGENFCLFQDELSDFLK